MGVENGYNGEEDVIGRMRQEVRDLGMSQRAHDSGHDPLPSEEDINRQADEAEQQRAAAS